jgi:hypothetical protein
MRCSRAGFAKFLANKSKPSEEKGENKHLSSTTVYLCHKPEVCVYIPLGFSVPNPAKKGRENELLY